MRNIFTFVGGAIIVLGLLGAFYLSTQTDLAVAVIAGISSIVSGLIFLGISHIIKLLEELVYISRARIEIEAGISDENENYSE